MDQADVIVTDRNAAADLVRFWPLQDGLAVVNRERVFARYWTHPDDFYEERRHKADKCAEVLAPNRVDPQLIGGVYVANQIALAGVQRANSELSVQVRSDMFF